MWPCDANKDRKYLVIQNAGRSLKREKRDHRTIRGSHSSRCQLFQLSFSRMSTYRVCGQPKKWNDVLHVNNIHKFQLVSRSRLPRLKSKHVCHLEISHMMVFGCLISCVGACPKIKVAKAGRLRLHPFRLATWIVKRATCIRRRVRFAASVCMTDVQRRANHQVKLRNVGSLMVVRVFQGP